MSRRIAAPPETRVAVVVGGGWREPGSIGGAVSRELARHGLGVAVVENDARSGDLAVEHIKRDGGVGALVVGDVSTTAGCSRILRDVMDRFGRLDVLVNNIGVASGGTVVDAKDVDWDVALNLNVLAAARMSRLAIPLMHGDGAIVNTSSIAAQAPGAHATYTVTKAALEGLTRAIALYHGADGIRANAVRVGEVATWRVLDGRTPEHAAAIREERRARTVLGTEGDCWDVARAIAFLAGDGARWITGQVLTVDGGASLKRAELWISPEDRIIADMNSSIA